MNIEARDVTVSVKLSNKKTGYCLLTVVCPTECQGKITGEMPPNNCGLTKISSDQIEVNFKEGVIIAETEVILTGGCIPLTESFYAKIEQAFGKHSLTT